MGSIKNSLGIWQGCHVSRNLARYFWDACQRAFVTWRRFIATSKFRISSISSSLFQKKSAEDSDLLEISQLFRCEFPKARVRASASSAFSAAPSFRRKSCRMPCSASRSDFEHGFFLVHQGKKLFLSFFGRLYIYIYIYTHTHHFLVDYRLLWII